MSKNLLNIAGAIVRSGVTQGYISPVAWAESSIDFKNVKGAFIDRFDLSLTPYLKDVISCWDFAGTKREMVDVAPQQMGKSLGGWQIGLLWSFLHYRCLSMVVYPSDQKAEKVNNDTIQPLMEMIPKLTDELKLPKTKRADSYRFSNFISYFQGSGSRISSYPAKITVADELADWVDEQEAASKIDDLRKRSRSFDESMLAIVSSPKGGEGCYVWQEFLKTSMGYWHLRCLGCGDLAIRSADIHNLQWELDANENIIAGSHRLICPKCQKEHEEKDKKEMNLAGGYVHLYPDKALRRPGFQWGALASQRASLSWQEIAEKRMESGRTAEVKTQILFDNSYRGLPHRQRKSTDSEKNTLISHCSEYPQPENIEALFFSADTQDDKWYWTIRGLSANESTYLLRWGESKTLTDMKADFDAGWNGIKCLAGIIDEGGHKSVEVSRFVQANRLFFTYKGTNMYKERFRVSDNKTRLIWAIAKQYQSDLLYYIYQQTSRDNSYWYLPPEQNLSPDYVSQILDMKPDSKIKSGNLYENWKSGGDDHYFDCEKMMIVIMDFAKRHIKTGWRTDQGAWKTKKRLIVQKATPGASFAKAW